MKDASAKTERMIQDQFGPALILNRYKDGLDSIRHHVSDFWLNHSFVLGHQWIYWNNRTSQLDELPDEPDRVQLTVDRIWPNSRTIIGKLTQRELVFENLPQASDDASIRGARLGETIIQATARDHRWEELREMAAWSAWKGGTCAIAVDWDPDGGRPIAGPAKDSAEIKGGDTVETVLSIPEFVVEPGVRDVSQARWWIRAQALPPEVVQDMYDLEETPKADISAGGSALMNRLVASSNLGGSGTTITDRTLVLTYYERPNSASPEGRVSVVVGEQIVWGENPEEDETSPWPFPFKDRLNLEIIRETVVEDEWAGHTVLSQTRSIQVGINVAWSSIIEHMKLAGNARLVVPESVFDTFDWTDLPGEVVPWPEGSTPPQYMQPAQLPGWVIDMPVNLALQMDDLMGVHDISRGTAPANIESGFGLSVLAEQDSTPVGRLSKEIARAFSHVGRMVLQLFEANVKAQRESTVAEPGQYPVLTEWTGKDLLGQVHVHVPLEAIVPRNRAATVQTAKELWTQQIITNPVDFLEIAEIPDRSSIIHRIDPDVSSARQENQLMAAGRVCIPATYDDDNKHIAEHNRFRKSQRYRMMTEEERNVFDMHVQAHETLAAEKAGSMQSRIAVGGPALAAAPTADQIPVPPGTFDEPTPSELPFQIDEATGLPVSIDPTMTPPGSAEQIPAPEAPIF